MKHISKEFKFIISLALPFIAGALGSLFTDASSGSWYANLSKPPFNPPGWVFGPVWTILYLLMGLAWYSAWSTPFHHEKKRIAGWAFITQLILNAGWSVVFFGLQRPDISLVVIAALLLAIVWNIISFRRVQKGTILLLIPYLAWVSFASVLNFYIWILNP